MLWQRLLTAAVGIPVLLWLTYVGGFYLTAAVALLALLSLRECYRLAARLGGRPEEAAEDGRRSGPGGSANRLLAVVQLAGYALGLFAPLASHSSAGPALLQTLLALALVAAVCLAYTMRMGRALPPAAARLFGVLLGASSLPALFSYLLLLRSLGAYPVVLPGLRVTLPSGACWLFLVFAACWAMDTAAYAVGRSWGKRKLCPTLSPGKTVEGAIAALVAALLITCGLGWWFGLPLWPAYGALLGLILGVVGQLGDLAESKLKRWAGVKDSGAILPGHGGILDRFDSLLLAAPAAYHFLRLVAGM